MASKFGLAGGIPERRVRPIWDAVDSRQFKNALKLVTSLLSKYPKSPYALVSVIQSLVSISSFSPIRKNGNIIWWECCCINRRLRLLFVREWGKQMRHYQYAWMPKSFCIKMIRRWWMISLSAHCRLCCRDSITVSAIVWRRIWKLVFDFLGISKSFVLMWIVDLATSCYAHACGKFPNNLELMMGLFNCYVREYSFVRQQQVGLSFG